MKRVREERIVFPGYCQCTEESGKRGLYSLVIVNVLKSQGREDCIPWLLSM